MTKLIAGVIAIAALVCLAVVFHCNSIWRIELNSGFHASYLIWQDAQSFPDKVSQLAKVTQILKNSEAGLLEIRNAWQTASNRFFADKLKFDELKTPVVLKKEAALRAYQQDPSAYAARFYPEELTRQKHEIERINHEIKTWEDSIQFDSRTIKLIQADASEPDSKIEQLLITEMGYTKNEVENAKLVDHWRKEGRLKIQDSQDEIKRCNEKLSTLRATLDQEPQMLVSNLIAQISRPFDIQITNIANQVGLENLQEEFQKIEARRQRLENQKAEVLNRQAQSLDAIFKDGIRIRLYSGRYFFLPKHSEGFLCVCLSGVTNGFLLHKVTADAVRVVRDSSVIKELPEEYFLAVEQKKWAALESNYSVLLSEGRADVEKKEWNAAKLAYEKALSFRPEDPRAQAELDKEWCFQLKPAGTALKIFRGYDVGTFTADGHKILLSGEKGTKLWNITTCQDAHIFSASLTNRTAIALNPDGNYGLTTSSDYIPYVDGRPQPINAAMILWKLSSGQEMRRIPVQEVSLSDVAYSSDGQYVISVGDGGRVKQWNAQNWTQVQTFEIESGLDVCCDAISPDGRFVMFGCRRPSGKYKMLEEGDFRGYVLYEISTGHQMWKVISRSYAGPICISPDGRRALVGDMDSDSGRLELWDVASGSFVKVLSETNESQNELPNVTSVAFSPDGHYANAGCMNANIMVIDLQTSRLVRTLQGRPYYVASDAADTHKSVWHVQVSPDGRYLLSSLGITSALWKLWDGDKNGE